MNISHHPIVKQAYELGCAIETFPASTEQTALSVKASELGEAIDKFVIEKGLAQNCGSPICPVPGHANAQPRSQS